MLLIAVVVGGDDAVADVVAVAGVAGDQQWCWWD